MTILQYGVENIHIIRCRHQSSWKSPDFVKAPDMADFGPDVKFKDEYAETPLPLAKPKPVSYLPVPRRNGEESYSANLHIKIMLFEPGTKRGVDIPSRENIDVDIEIFNIWPQKESKDVNKVKEPHLVRLTGKLSKSVCEVPIAIEMLADWLKPSKELKAQINENLIDFRFRIPSIVFDGRAFAGESSNRIFLYRRKIIVFFPGVFGSQFQITTPDKQVVGFPDFFDESFKLPTVVGDLVNEKGWYKPNLTIKQKIEVLECDAGGKPLANPDKAKLLEIGIPHIYALVYDTYDKCQEAIYQHYKPLPERFLLYRLIIAIYDWRKDLNDTATQKLAQLKIIQDGPLGRRAKDSDDQIAVIGHSTGGLIIRGMMQESGAEKVISHAFFMNVPFRGAPKTMSVIPTGRDPFNGQSMIPFVDPLSLRAIALTAPIVYYLSPSEYYPNSIYKHDQSLDKKKQKDNEKPQTKDKADAASPPAESLSRPEELKEWINLAIQSGFMPSRKVIPKDAPLTDTQRRELAFSATAWAQYWEERYEHMRGRTLIDWVIPAWCDSKWEQRELAKRNLSEQNVLRVEQGFSDELSQNAQAFHQKCETMASNAKWQDKAYIFYSVSKEATTLAVKALRSKYSKTYSDKMAFMRDAKVYVRNLTNELIMPPHNKTKPYKQKHKKELKINDKILHEGFAEHSVIIHENWQRNNNECMRERWRFCTLQQIDGDGTVPLCSLLGFGGPAKVFKKLLHKQEMHYKKEKEANIIHNVNTAKDLVLGPDHVAAPNHPWAWARIIDVLQGYNVDEHLAKVENVAKNEQQSRNTVNLITGNDTDTDLLVIKDRYFEETNDDAKEYKKDEEEFDEIF